MAWEEVGSNNENSEKKEVKYLKFPVGATRIRVLDSEPYSRWTHWLPAPANGGKGVSIDCIGKGCPVCETINMEKAKGTPREKIRFSTKKTHSINVLVKSDTGSEVNVLEQGNGLFGQLKDVMVMMSSIGMKPDLTTVDVMVNRTGTGFSDTKYSVMPLMNEVKPLTEEELNLEKYDLKNLKPKLEPAQIIAIMNGAKLEDVAKEDMEEDKPVEPSEMSDTAPFKVDFTQAVK